MIDLDWGKITIPQARYLARYGYIDHTEVDTYAFTVWFTIHMDDLGIIYATDDSEYIEYETI